MKKLIIGLICVLMICSLVCSCEKDPDEEIKDPNDQEMDAPNGKDDDPNNGYGDVIYPKD